MAGCSVAKKSHSKPSANIATPRDRIGLNVLSQLPIFISPVSFIGLQARPQITTLHNSQTPSGHGAAVTAAVVTAAVVAALGHCVESIIARACPHNVKGT